MELNKEVLENNELVGDVSMEYAKDLGLSPMDRINLKIKECQYVKRLIGKEELIFKGDSRIDECLQTEHLLSEYGIEYQLCEFKNMIIIKIIG